MAAATSAAQNVTTTSFLRNDRQAIIDLDDARSGPGGSFGLPCALILRYLAEGEEHDRLRLNAILREHGVVS